MTRYHVMSIVSYLSWTHGLPVVYTQAVIIHLHIGIFLPVHNITSHSCHYASFCFASIVIIIIIIIIIYSLL